MLHRRSFLLGSLLLPFVLAQDTTPFDCHVNLNGTLKFDLTPLAGEHTVQRTRETPPSSMLDDVLFDLCTDLKPREGVAEADQCPSGTRVCLTKTNKKGGDADRIVAVVPLARTDVLAPEFTALTSPEGLSIVFHGAPYPTTEPIPQSFNLTLLCDQTTSNIEFKSYNGSQLQVEWKAPAGCKVSSEPPADEKPNPGEGEGGSGGKKEDSKSVGSGLGWFFLLLLLAFAAYFALGAYYNYATYGASGMDLIPHRDFWRDVPYLVRDVVSHLCSSFRPRHSASRGGYIAV